MKKNVFESVSEKITNFTGSTMAFILAIVFVFLWVVTGPLFGFSDTWQLVINTLTNVITFFIVFLIQRSQNKDAMAIQLKLNELVAATKGASNRLIDIEDLSEKDLDLLHNFYKKLALMAKREKDIKESHSVEEAERKHKLKLSA